MKKFAATPKHPRVALLVESSRAYGRGTLAGVAKYIRQNGHWSIFFQEHSFCDDIPAWLAGWRGDGIIARLDNDALVGSIQRLRVPVVYLRHIVPTPKTPYVITNNPAVSYAAFEHLKERGFRHYAFCGFNGADYSDERRDSFVQCVTEAGRRCHVFDETQVLGKGNTVSFEHEGLIDNEHVADWLLALPKPVGLMACNDMRGQQVLNACRAVGIAVPDEVAVIGADNDTTLCDLSDPPLSSVVPNTERIGYEAAGLLALMMAGKKPRQHEVLIDPIGVVTRRSTEVLAIEDRHIALAARFIREHACEGVDVSDVLRAVPLSRSTLERRFTSIMGHSPKHEILRVRLNRAKQLLAESDFTLDVIAEKIGLEHTEYLGRIFKKKNGVTPARFRALSRTNAAADRLP
jgi:LacI family transcriptional regulator